MKVLVIDDNAVNRRYAKSVIEEDGISVFEANNGETGIATAIEQKPNVILVDIQMPDMDGFECLKRLKGLPEIQAPILAITAFSNPEDRELFIREGFQDYITKPVKPNVLSSTIKYWLKTDMHEKRVEENSLMIEFVPEVKEELLKHMDPVGLEELFLQFKDEINEYLDQLIFLHSSKNYYNICSILHIIKGNAGSLGFFELSELASQLEIKIKLGKYDTLEIELLDLRSYSKRLFDKYETQFNLNL